MSDFTPFRVLVITFFYRSKPKYEVITTASRLFFQLISRGCVAYSCISVKMENMCLTLNEFSLKGTQTRPYPYTKLDTFVTRFLGEYKSDLN